MKKIKLNDAKLQLNKERVSNLTKNSMDNVNGGAPNAPTTGIPTLPMTSVSECASKWCPVTSKDVICKSDNCSGMETCSCLIC